MKKSLTLLLAALFFAASVAGCAPELALGSGGR